MTDFIIKKLPYDLTSNACLALVGQYTKRLGISAVVDHKFPVAVGGIPSSDILKSYLGLLVQGKNDFDAIDEFRGDAFFTRALDVNTTPSCLTVWSIVPGTNITGSVALVEFGQKGVASLTW